MEGDIQKLKESTIEHRFFEFTFPHRFGWFGFAIAMLLFLSSIVLFISSLSIPDVIQTEDAQVIQGQTEFMQAEFVESTLGKGFDGEKGAYFITSAEISTGVLLHRYCTTNSEGETTYHKVIMDDTIIFSIGSETFTADIGRYNLDVEHNVGDSCYEDIREGDRLNLFILKQESTFSVLSFSEMGLNLPEVTQRENTQRLSMSLCIVGSFILMLVTPTSLANDIREFKQGRDARSSVLYDGNEYSMSTTTTRKVDDRDWILSSPTMDTWTPTKYGPDGDGSLIPEHPRRIGTPKAATLTLYSLNGSLFVLFSVWLISDLNARDTDVFGDLIGSFGKYALLLFALLWFISSVRKWKLLHNIIDTPTSTVRGVAVGSAELVGQVRPYTPTHHLTVGGKTFDGIVGYRWKEEEERCTRDSEGNESCSWHLVDSGEDWSKFILHDGSGGILLDATSWKDMNSGDELDSWRIGKRRWTVHAFCSGDPVYALGTVEKRTLDEQEEGLDKTIGSANIIMRGSKLEGMQAKLSRGTEFALLGGLRSTTEAVVIPALMLLASFIPLIW